MVKFFELLQQFSPNYRGILTLLVFPNQENGNQRHNKVLVSFSNVAKCLLEFLGLAALPSFLFQAPEVGAYLSVAEVVKRPEFTLYKHCPWFIPSSFGHKKC